MRDASGVVSFSQLGPSPAAISPSSSRASWLRGDRQPATHSETTSSAKNDGFGTLRAYGTRARYVVRDARASYNPSNPTPIDTSDAGFHGCFDPTRRGIAGL